MTACSYEREREAEWSLRWLSKQFIFLRSLSSLDSHRSDMTDQDKWSGSDVRSVQSSNCPRQKQKGTLSTRLSSLQCLFNSFHPHYVRNKTVNISRIQLFEGALFFLQFLFVFFISLDLRPDLGCSFMNYYMFTFTGSEGQLGQKSMCCHLSG